MNKIFSTKLFKEAIRQLKIPASLFLGIMIGLSIIMTIANLSSAMEYYDETNHILTIDTMEALIFLPFIFAIAVPVFVFRLFGFLTKRNASDFYHAIPNTRTCIYVSYSAAILAVATFFVVFGTAIPCIVYSLSDKYIYFNTASACFYGINTFTCVVLCLGILLLSSSLTGTLFTNALFALGIMFAPRFMTTIITESLTNHYSEIIPYNANFGIFSNDMNNIWAHVGGIFLDAGYIESIFVLTGAAVYTLILGFIYYALGLLAFNKRHSEQAESSAQNPIAHNIIRCGIGFVFVMFISIANYEAYEFEFIEIALIVFASVFGMIIFELITTKKVKRLLNVVASIPVVAILGIILFFILKYAGHRIISYEPDTDKINYIQYSPGNSLSENYDYFNYTTAKVKFKDEKIIEFLADAYNEQLEIFKECLDNDRYYYEHMNNIYEEGTIITVRFNEGLSSRERNIYLSDTKFAELNELIAANADYLDAFRSLPKNLNIEWGGEAFNIAEQKKIVAEFEKDLKTMEPTMIMSVLSSGTSYKSALVSLEASTVTNVGELYITLRITPDTPKAFTAAKDILAKKAKADETIKDTDSIRQLAKKLTEYNDDYSSCRLSLSVYDLKNNEIVMNMSLNERTESEFDYEESFHTLAYGSYNELIDTINEFMTNTAEPESANYVIFASTYCHSYSKYYEDDELFEYSSVFYSNNTEAVEYFKAEDTRKEYYGEDTEIFEIY